jgi:hypothetical protein
MNNEKSITYISWTSNLPLDAIAEGMSMTRNGSFVPQKSLPSPWVASKTVRLASQPKSCR